MKLDQLRKIIREEVRAAVKEELQEVMNEAVKYASTPDTPKVQKFADYKPVTQKNLERKWSTGKLNSGTVPLEEMLAQTANQMTAEEYKNITNAQPPTAPNLASTMASSMGMSGPQPGLDISKLDFVSKAKSVLEAANAKDKVRLG
jgi:hypothetical protein